MVQSRIDWHCRVARSSSRLQSANSGSTSGFKSPTGSASASASSKLAGLAKTFRPKRENQPTTKNTHPKRLIISRGFITGPLLAINHLRDRPDRHYDEKGVPMT